MSPFFVCLVGFHAICFSPLPRFFHESTNRNACWTRCTAIYHDRSTCIPFLHFYGPPNALSLLFSILCSAVFAVLYVG